ncbi:hypothetical protein SPHINGO391_390270 [Sphingomonas aurantiaca]|uniref:Uncharacterized protein n=1 Tax=Sphingomonas aurantiaca TaxID=185949 RepID=A0A5E7YQU6_9SPHN|nr:hypothetical protein SPHINGO391_390270 [Sphingomonas aurantiaca]
MTVRRLMAAVLARGAGSHHAALPRVATPAYVARKYRERALHDARRYQIHRSSRGRCQPRL